LVKEIEGLTIDGGHELVLVNDGSRDATAGLCRELLRDARIPMIFVNHARNYGEHNAVLTGYRHARAAPMLSISTTTARTRRPRP
jgi:glycosyltransferase involved in cell wall biosynthesis